MTWTFIKTRFRDENNIVRFCDKIHIPSNSNEWKRQTWIAISLSWLLVLAPNNSTCERSATEIQGWRNRGGRGSHASPSPDFDRSVNPISTRWGGADYAHQITARPLPPYFQTFRHPWEFDNWLLSAFFNG